MIIIFHGYVATGNSSFRGLSRRKHGCAAKRYGLQPHTISASIINFLHPRRGTKQNRFYFCLIISLSTIIRVSRAFSSVSRSIRPLRMVRKRQQKRVAIITGGDRTVHETASRFSRQECDTVHVSANACRIRRWTE